MPWTYAVGQILILRFIRDTLLNKRSTGSSRSSDGSSTTKTSTAGESALPMSVVPSYSKFAGTPTSGGSKDADEPSTFNFMKPRHEQGRHQIINAATAPFFVVPFLNFRANGAIPRSDTKLGGGIAKAKMGSTTSISQPHEEGWSVIFVSHRWWGGNHPDLTQSSMYGKSSNLKRNLKHGIICRGIEALIKRDKLDPERVAIWIDYACIEQDNDEEMQKGVDSLIAYAAQADCTLIAQTHPLFCASFPYCIAMRASALPRVIALRSCV